MCYQQGFSRRCAVLFIAALQFAQGCGTFLYASSGTKKFSSQSTFFVVMATSAMNMCAGLLLCVGVNSNRPSLLRIWLGWAAVIVTVFIICVPIIVILNFVGHYKDANLGASLSRYSLLFLLHCFFIYVVYGFYDELLRSQENYVSGDAIQSPDHELEPDNRIHSVNHTISANRISAYKVRNETFR